VSTKEECYHLFKPGDLVRYNKSDRQYGGMLALVLKQGSTLKQLRGTNAANLLFYQVKWCNTGKITMVLASNVEAAY